MPEIVGPCLRGQLAAFRAGAPNRPCLPLCAERPGCRLTVRLIMRPDDRHCLLLEEHSLDRRTACCRALGLTPREAPVLAWVTTGRPDAEIAVGLRVAPGRVKKHLANIYAKLGVQTRHGAVLKALEIG